MITRTETVPAPPYHCAICRMQDADYFIDTQVQTDEGAMFICNICFQEMVNVSNEFISLKSMEKEVARLRDKAKNNEALVEKFTRADRVLKDNFGLDFGNLLSLDEGQQNLRGLAEKIEQRQAYLDQLEQEAEDKKKTLASYDSQIETANNIINEKLREVDILNLPLEARLEAYHGSLGGIPVGVPSESSEDGGAIFTDSATTSGAAEADSVSF